MKTVKSANSSPWNKGKLVGQKSPLRLRDIWGIRIRLERPDQAASSRCRARSPCVFTCHRNAAKNSSTCAV